VAIPSNKPQNRILLVGGIIFALLAGVVVFIAVSKSSSTPPAQPETPVVVAATNILAGSQLSTANLTTRPYLNVDLPVNSYTTTTQLVGQTLPVSVSAGTPITEQLLQATAGSSGSSTLTTPTNQLPIANNDVALAIPAHGATPDTTVDQMTVGYYIQAGDQIDIIGDLGGPTTNSHQVQYVFQDIPVLAVGYATATTTPASGSATTTAAPSVSAPSYFVVEMTRAQAELMTALLTGDFAQTSPATNGSPPAAGNPALVLKYVLRPVSEYGKTNSTGDFVPQIENISGPDTVIPSASDSPVTPQSLSGAFANS
jgi:Flp pilus assembly protein CpaB